MESIAENVNENYEPVEPNYYGYRAINSLSVNIDDLLDSAQTYKVNMCTYEVNNQHKYPFLKYLLYKNKTSNKCSFLPFFITGDKSEDIVLRATNLVKKMLDNVAQTADNVAFNGFKVLNNNIYIFFDATRCTIKQPDLLWSTNNIWSTTIDEIVNTKSVCNILIDECVTQLFVQNPDLCYLQNQQNENYVLPIVAYVARDDPKLHFTFVFGVSKSLNTSILGAYYYFTNYKNTFHPNSTMIVNHVGETNSPTHNVSQTLFARGIIRFALFIEKTKIIQNSPNNPIDNSEIKKNKSQYDLSDINHETLLTRISDHNGKWSADYDSAYIGHILLDDGNYIKDTPITVIRDYDQQVPLSYHYITNLSQDTIRNEIVYDIM
jgi:hypothetical protein